MNRTTLLILMACLTMTARLLAGPVPLRAETLAEAVDAILHSHPEVRSAVHSRQAVATQVNQARADYFPSVDILAGSGTGRVYDPGDSDIDPRELTISLRQNLFAGFATLNETRRQQSRSRAAAFRLQAISENIALKTSRVYLDVLRQQDLLQLARENLIIHQRISDQIRLRSESGISTRTDMEQITSRLALARANEITARTNLMDAKTSYQAVVGHLPGELIQPPLLDQELPADLEKAQAMALREHPSLKSAEADLAARQARARVARSSLLPRIDLEVDRSWKEEFDDSNSGQDDLVAMVRLRYNLFRGGRDQASRLETSHLVQEARELRNNIRRQIIESIRLSWMAYQSVRERLPFLETRVQASRATARAYTKQWNIGRRTLLDVLDAEAERIDGEQDLVHARYDLIYACCRILNGCGRLVHTLGLKWPREARIDNHDQNSEKRQDS
ncbi:channel protein TolC [Desulfolithobacter dissulfuricans]|uniref:Channel protein TolC n=1 Tax=Desulfolithobacter dissulfuricans TaxID=2795293 RepID=A0A915TXT8_9BACT|nr:TolC family outer membrane protein [Desulfolithobacter dissulfuricans]BCO07741.1 channel protein TolC [Desulfolithobacter dissulfuricans]